MSDPQYGTQIVRFAETAQVADDEEIYQFRVCKRTGRGNPPTIVNSFTSSDVKNKDGSDLNNTDVQGGRGPNQGSKNPKLYVEALGVTQQRLREVNNTDQPTEQNASDNLRLVPFATSGLLLIEQGDLPLRVGDPLSINYEGKADRTPAGSGGNVEDIKSVLVEINSTTPEVHSTVTYGKKHYALVYFS